MFCKGGEMKYLLLLVLTSCGAVKNSCDINGYNDLCYTLLGDYRDGKDGVNGVDGKDGKDGSDGISCTVVENVDGATITCGSNSVQITDGDDAVQSPYAIEEIIDPCGDYPGYKDEVLLKTHNGTLIAYYEGSGKRFLTALSDGNYKTTDKQKCSFSVTNGEYNE
jgi:hypothetical protein